MAERTGTHSELLSGDLAIGVGEMPGRKSECLTVRRGSVVYTTAYFRSPEEAGRFWSALIELFERSGVKLVRETE